MKTEHLHIRQLSIDHLAALTPPFADYLRGFDIRHDGDDVRRFLSHLLWREWVRGFGAFSEDDIVAFCLCTLNYSQVVLGPALQVEDFFVSVPFRRRGVGAMLLAAIEEHAASRGIQRLFGLALPPEREYFRKAGWEPTAHALMKRNIVARHSDQGQMEW